MISEGEKWARIVIFIIVGAYTLVVILLTIRFIIRTCWFPHEEERSRWQSILAEEEARRLRLRADESPPPPFLAALKCPLPRPNSVTEEEPPPSYDDVYASPANMTVHVPAPAEPHCQCQCNKNKSSKGNLNFDFEGVTVVHL